MVTDKTVNKTDTNDEDIITLLPKDKTKTLDRFIDGFRKLADTCGMNQGSCLEFRFENGSKIGVRRLLKEIWNLPLDED